MSDVTRTEYSNKLDLNCFFYALYSEKALYTIIKFDDNFPNYYQGSDIDVFCYHLEECARLILEVGNNYVKQGFEVKVTEVTSTQIFIDFFLEDILDFRFDLYGSLPSYKNIHLKEHYVYSVIENAQSLQQEFKGQEYPIYIPSSIDDLLLRYVEYVEWYGRRPDKIKHIEYILGAVEENPESRVKFLDKLHAYTKIPEPDYNEENELSEFGQGRFWLEKLKSYPRHLLRFVASKVQKIRTFVSVIYRRVVKR